MKNIPLALQSWAHVRIWDSKAMSASSVTFRLEMTRAFLELSVSDRKSFGRQVPVLSRPSILNKWRWLMQAGLDGWGGVWKGCENCAGVTLHCS